MKRCIALLLLFAALAAACGSDDSTADGAVSDDPATSDSTASSDSAMSDSAMSDSSHSDSAMSDSAMSDSAMSDGATGAPQAIVSLSPTATEMLFAIGAGSQVIAVDDNSNYPPEAPTSALSGYQPNVESILAMAPDMVVLSDATVEADLNSAGVATLVQPAAVTLSDVYSQIEQLGAATGHIGEAAELVGNMQSDVQAILDDTPQPEAPLTYFHEIDSTLFTATSATFIGEIYAMFGLVNVADPADADGESFGYPQLSEEFLIDANPDLIFLSDVLYGEDIATVSARPGWDALAAVQAGNVIELDSDIASRWGPRVVDLMQSISQAVLTTSVPA